MKKIFFIAIAMIAFTGSANAQFSSDPKTNDCVQKGFKASEDAICEGKTGEEATAAANKAYKDCMGTGGTVVSEPKGSKTATTKQPNTISR